MTELLEKQEAPISRGEEDVSQFLNEIRRYPLLTAEQELALARRCSQGDEEAIRQMVNSNLRLVVSVARNYAGRGVPLLDLIQEGSIGLLAAARKFDYTQQTRFSTYATKGIHRGIARYFAQHGRMIRIPEYTAASIRLVQQETQKLIQQNGVPPTNEQIAAVCGMTSEQVAHYRQLQPETCSLDAPTGEEEESALGRLLEDLQAPQPQENLIRRELEQTMDTLLGMLTERQRTILRLHFGMADGTCHSLAEIAKTLGISKERVRQIEKQAMEKLQKLGANLGLEDFLGE